MKTVAISALLWLLILASPGCLTYKRCLEKFPPSRDTLRILQTKDTIIYRDTTVYVPIPGETKHDSVFIKTLVPVNSERLRSDTPLAWAETWVENSFLMLTLTQKDTTILTNLKNAVKESIHWRSEYEKISEIPREVKYIPKIYKQALTVCIVLFASVFIYFGFFIYKKFFVR